GKARNAVDTYVHASGKTFAEVEAAAGEFIKQGFRHVRVQVALPGMDTYGTRAAAGQTDSNDERRQEQVWEPAPYVRTVPRLFEHLRKALGEEVELLHDVHERTPPILAIQLVKSLEPYRPFFVEDPFSP